MSERIIVIDGNSLINRAYYAVKVPMITKDGIYTQGIFGFLNILSKIKKDYDSEYIAVAFDRKAPTFRHEKYDSYKAGRKKMPPELAMQMPLLKDVLNAMNIKQLELDGWEADDIIGTVSARAEEEGLDVLIITGDRDELQLATDRVSVLITRKGISEFDIYNRESFEEEYGFTPAQFVDCKGLMGDSSDNYPGVPGIGKVTASKLIRMYGSIDSIYDNIDSMPEGGMKQKLIDGRMSAYMSQELARISTDAPVDICFSEFRWDEPDYDRLIAIYRKLEFNSFLRKLRIPSEHEMHKEESKEALIVSGEDVKKSLDGVSSAAVKVIHDGSHTGKPDVSGVGYMVGSDSYYTSDVESFIKASSGVKLTGHGLKDDIYALMNCGASWYDVEFDTEIAEYVLDPSRNSYDFRNLTLDYLNRTVESDSESVEVQTSLFDDGGRKNAEFTRRWCSAVKDTESVQKEKIEKSGLSDVLYNIELPLVPILAEMEYFGVRCDAEVLDELGERIRDEIIRLRKKIYEICGEEFNINSPGQLGTVLFEKMKLPSGKKTKKGYSTSADVLEKIRDESEAIPLILEYRTLSKLNGTYVEGLIPLISENGRIHAHFQQTVAATGRLSCTEPNLQNIPVRNEFGRLIRKAFVPETGCIFEGADYSQIELRVLAHMSGDEELISAFNEGKDIHRNTASKVLGIPEDEVTPAQRSSAKAVNFGVIYGMSGFGLSEELSISRREAEKYISDYFNRYQSVKRLMDEQISSCRNTGFVTTISGRKRQISEIGASNYMVRQAGERLAMNTPIQGSAADIIKIAMIRVRQALRDAGLRSRLVLQIHDELIIETYEDEKETVRKLLRDNMENAYKLKVKLIAEVNEGTDWYRLK